MWGVMATRGGVWPFHVKNGPKKNCDVSRDGMVTEKEFTVKMIWVLMASAAGEPWVDGDESAMAA
jgi:hypothetical protein